MARNNKKTFPPQPRSTTYTPDPRSRIAKILGTNKDAAKPAATQVKTPTRLEKALLWHDVKYDPTWSQLRLEDLLRRAKLGRVAYTNCPTSELELFCQQRRIPDKKVSWDDDAHRARLIDRLERADDAPKFKYFMELPPEMRVLVYELVLVHGAGDSSHPIDVLKGHRSASAKNSRGLDGWKDALPTMSLTRVSIQIRKEALPVFYANNSFLLDTNRGYIPKTNDTYPGDENQATTKRWLAEVVGVNMINIKTVIVTVTNTRCRGFAFACAMLIRISITPQGVEVAHWNEESQNSIPRCADCAKSIVAIEQIKAIIKQDDDAEACAGPALTMGLVDKLLSVMMLTEWEGKE